MNYESASRTVKQSATAVASAHLALIVLNVSVMSSSLPNAYVSDPAANCGARYLVNVAAHNVLQAGLFAIAALVIALMYSGWISGRKLTFMVVGEVGRAFHVATISSLGIISLFLFLSAASQLGRLGSPPRLPESFEKTHVCPVLPETP